MKAASPIRYVECPKSYYRYREEKVLEQNKNDWVLYWLSLIKEWYIVFEFWLGKIVMMIKLQIKLSALDLFYFQDFDFDTVIICLFSRSHYVQYIYFLLLNVL